MNDYHLTIMDLYGIYLDDYILLHLIIVCVSIESSYLKLHRMDKQ